MGDPLRSAVADLLIPEQTRQSSQRATASEHARAARVLESGPARCRWLGVLDEYRTAVLVRH
jgi:hypothetical protein